MVELNLYQKRTKGNLYQKRTKGNLYQKRTKGRGFWSNTDVDPGLECYVILSFKRLCQRQLSC